MPKPIVIIDDDLLLIQELRDVLLGNFSQLRIVAPPELLLDIRGIRESISGSSVVVLDLNIGGSDSAGEAFLKRVRRQLSRESVPVVVWSKYIAHTVIFEPRGIFEVEYTDKAELRFVGEIEAEEMCEHRIRSLRRIYPGTRAFVSKAYSRPAEALAKILRYLGTLPKELTPLE